MTDIEQNKVDFMVDPPASDRLQEVKARYGDRFRLEDSINTYYFFMNTEQAAVQRPQGAPGDQLRGRSRGARTGSSAAACIRPQQILPPGMPGYQEYKLYPGPDMNKAKQLIAEANPADRDITVWTDDEPDRKRIGEYYHDLLHPAGLQRDAQGDRGRRVLDDDRQPVDARRGHRVRRLVPGLPASRRLLPPAAERREHPADQRQQLSPGSTSPPTTPSRTSC